MSEPSATLTRFIEQLRRTSAGGEPPRQKTLHELLVEHRTMFFKSFLFLPVNEEDEALIDDLMRRRLARGVMLPFKRE
jgi:hypothetical protein